jgi:hypothetical protein
MIRRLVPSAAACAVLVLSTACAPPPAMQPAPADCSRLELDLRRGTLNGVAPTASMAEVKERLRCSTGETEEGATINRGGGVFFVDHDFYFYTHRDYIEVRSRFAGAVTPDVLGGDARQAARRLRLGPSVRTLPLRRSLLFRTGYGCVEVRTDDGGVVNEVAAHARPCEDVPDDS